MSVGKDKKITLVGAGPVGSLLAIFLAKRGFEVEVFERRPDIRTTAISAGRSINLALSTRGLYALEQVGLKDEVLKAAIPMKGRMMHSRQGEISFQQYGRNENEFINSASRGDLNKTLMTQAESTGKVKIHFNHQVSDVDFQNKKLTLQIAKEKKEIPYQVLIGTDGSASKVRETLLKKSGYKGSEKLLDYGYKEFHIPAGSDDAFLMEKNALHIWPRGTYMLIALPNFDGSFTATLFLPFKGINSFQELKSESDAKGFFRENFIDALNLLPNLGGDFMTNPTGQMVTVKCEPWNLEDSVLLLGDAAHAIVPFFGQGMNCGFEDCTVLAKILDDPKTSNWKEVFSRFQTSRKENCDAIADMAVENFIEMRDKVGSAQFLLEKEVEQALQKRFPEDYISRYALVTFSRVPYNLALKAGVVANSILAELCRNINSVDKVNWAKAEELIQRRLSPIIKEAKSWI